MALLASPGALSRRFTFRLHTRPRAVSVCAAGLGRPFRNLSTPLEQQPGVRNDIAVSASARSNARPLCSRSAYSAYASPATKMPCGLGLQPVVSDPKSGLSDLTLLAVCSPRVAERIASVAAASVRVGIARTWHSVERHPARSLREQVAFTPMKYPFVLKDSPMRGEFPPQADLTDNAGRAQALLAWSNQSLFVRF